jgi:transmembrane sensor
MGRKVALEHGQILLRLNGHHDPVTVMSGDLQLVDVGTVFEVTRADRSTRVAVSEGVVMAEPSSARLRIAAGQRLDARDGDSLLRAEPAPIESVGGWSEGQLTYFAEPIERVAADLRRSTGMDFSVDPAMRRRPFSGTLSVASVRRDPSKLGPLLDASVTRSGDQWIIAQGSGRSNLVPPAR